MPDNADLKPGREQGWASGFLNMLAKENKSWWNARSLAVQLLVWLVIINGPVALAVIIIPPLTHTSVQPTDGSLQDIPAGAMGMTPAQTANFGLMMFFELSGIAMLIGVVIIGHDSIVRERESGTAAWLLSKPLSRRSFVLSKLVANNLGMLTIIVLAQGIVAYSICSAAGHNLVNIPRFLAGLGLLGLDLMFFMVLSIALGAFTLSKGVTLGVPLLTALAGSIVLPFRPELGNFMPWHLMGTAVSLSTGTPVAAAELYPVAATAIWIIVFALAALYRFESLEL
jgi:ABC-2 type transport system permease protein